MPPATSSRMDARQRKTRLALYAALDALLGERPYAGITVTDLVLRADVGRQTFYRHFDSIDAMLEERLRSDLAEQLAFARQHPASAGHLRWVEAVTAFAFERAGQQPRLYRLILSGQAGSEALKSFGVQIAEIMNIAPALPVGMTGDASSAHFVRSFYAGAISALLLEWVTADNGRTPGDMGALFARLSTLPP